MSSKNSASHSASGGGYSPFIEPKPKYPPASEAAFHFCRDVFIQGGIHGIAVTYLAEPLFRYTRLLSNETTIFSFFLSEGEEQLSSYSQDRFFFAAWFNAIHSGFYIFALVLWCVLYYTRWLSQYQMDRSKAHLQPSKELFINTLKEAAFGQLIVTPILTSFAFATFQTFGMQEIDAPLPSMPAMFAAFSFAHIVNDALFYYTHRLGHVTMFYKTIHKQHHAWKGPITIAAEYARK
jgi:hypothetical protein